MEKQRYGIVKMILIEKDKFRELTLPDWRYTTKLNQDNVVLAKRKTDKWNRLERPETDPIYSELLFNPGANTISWS